MIARLILLMVLRTVSSSSNQFDCPKTSTNHVGCILPQKPYVVIGTNLTLNCILNDGKGSESLYFRTADTNVSSDYQSPIPPSVLQLKLPVTDSSLQGVTVYCINSALGTTVGEQQIEVEYAPRNVTDLHVVVEEWRSLNVTWKRPEHVNSADIATSVFWTAEGAYYSYNCTVQTETSCAISGHDYKDSPLYRVIIQVSNIRTNASLTQKMDIHPKHYVRVSSVKLTTDSNQTCIYLHWRHKHSHKHLVFRVNVHGAFNVSLSFNTSNLSSTTCGLHPGVEYEVGVAAGLNESMYWSRENITHLTTLQTYPERGALVTPGLYSVTEDLCEDEGGARTVRVYLRPPEELFWNGKLTNYSLVYVPAGARSNISDTAEIDSVFHQVHLSCSLEYDVYISVNNKIGSSPPSHLHIPRQDKVAEPRYVRMSDRGSSMLIEWKLQEREEMVSYWTVVWCNATSVCQTGVSWTTVNACSTSTPMSKSNSRYGVAMVTHNNHSSGIAWASCVYQYDKVPRRAPELERVQADSHLSLTVSWRLQTCVDRVLVSHYIVQCCLHHTNTCRTERVGSETSQLQLQQLEEGQLYKVRLKQVTAGGLESNFSSPLFATPTFIGLPAGHFAGITAGSVILGAIILGAVTTCLRSATKRCGERDDIEVPPRTPPTESVGETKTPVKSVTVPSSPELQEESTAVNLKPECEQVARIPQNYSIMAMAGQSEESVLLSESSVPRIETGWTENSNFELDSGFRPGSDYTERDSLTNLELELQDTNSGSEDGDSIPYIAVGVAKD